MERTHKREKKIMYNKASEVYNELSKTKIDAEYDPVNLMFDVYDYSDWLEEESDGSAAKDDDTTLKGDKNEFVDLLPMLPLGDYQEVKERKGIKIFIPNKLLIRLPILLSQIKTRNESYKLKNKIRKIVYLLYQHNKRKLFILIDLKMLTKIWWLKMIWS